jgi:hypothetical protein
MALANKKQKSLSAQQVRPASFDCPLQNIFYAACYPCLPSMLDFAKS